MKKVLSIILLIISFSASAQTSLDSLMFSKINEYRVSNGVAEISWDTNVFKASNHHSTYLKLLSKDSLKTTITHYEKIDVDSIDEIFGINDRLIYYAGIKDRFYGENITGTIKSENYPDKGLVDIMFNNWVKSKQHNEIMLNKDAKFGACSIVTLVNDFKTTVDGKTIRLKKCFATLNLYL